MAQRSFDLIQGGTGGETRRYTFDTGVVDEHGRRILRQENPPSGGDGGGNMTPPLWKLDIPRDVQIAKWGLAGLLTLIGIFFWFVYLPDVKEIRKDIGSVNTNVAVLAKSTGDIQTSLDRIEDRLDRRDDQKAVETNAVRKGTQ